MPAATAKTNDVVSNLFITFSLLFILLFRMYPACCHIDVLSANLCILIKNRKNITYKQLFLTTNKTIEPQSVIRPF
ncbi:hypothetical protein ST43_08095 [Prevotella pectinovora]|nr:hypothetical protein ST43_08095 [Prevotella pectinovora]